MNVVMGELDERSCCEGVQPMVHVDVAMEGLVWLEVEEEREGKNKCEFVINPKFSKLLG